jgi:uncharacterized protein (UPF0332 family)
MPARIFPKLTYRAKIPIPLYRATLSEGKNVEHINESRFTNSGKIVFQFKNFPTFTNQFFKTLSKLQEKSNLNFDAAALLLDKGLYAPSVHCSYYSCLQLLKFAINDFFGIDYSTLSSNIATLKTNSHQYIVNFVYSELKKNVQIDEARKFKHTIKDLKNYRVESDYHDIDIDSEKGYKAYEKAKELRGYLKEMFHV